MLITEGMIVMAEQKDNVKDGAGIESLFGLWAGRGKVAFTCHVKEDILIPKGSKIIVFQNPDANNSNRRPNLSVCSVVEE